MLKGRPQGATWAYLKDQGRVYVENFNSLKRTANIRFDPGLGMRSRVRKVNLDDLDFTREWKFQ